MTCRDACDHRQDQAGYEGQVKGGDAVSRELIRVAVGKVYDRYFEGVNMQPVVQWFDIGGNLKLSEDVHAAEVARQLNSIRNWWRKKPGAGPAANEPDAVRALRQSSFEGLHAHRKISRSEERGFAAEDRKRPVQEPEEKSARAAASSIQLSRRDYRSRFSASGIIIEVGRVFEI